MKATKSFIQTRKQRATQQKFALGALIVVLIAAALIGFGIYHAHQYAGMPTNPAIEARWGVRVTQIGVTADGGMLDLRYVVLDPDKVLSMMENVNNLPVMIDEASGALINTTSQMAMVHNNILVGTTYFLLYDNTNGSVKSGSFVTVKFGNLLLQHVMAK